MSWIPASLLSAILALSQLSYCPETTLIIHECNDIRGVTALPQELTMTINL
jgi:hypothetical protein